MHNHHVILGNKSNSSANVLSCFGVFMCMYIHIEVYRCVYGCTVCVHMSIHVCEYGHMHPSICVKGHKTSMGASPRLPPSLRQAAAFVVFFHCLHRLAGLRASRDSPVSVSHLPVRGTEITGAHTTYPAFIWFLGSLYSSPHGSTQMLLTTEPPPPPDFCF